MRQKAKDNDTESFHGKLSCDELELPAQAWIEAIEI